MSSRIDTSDAAQPVAAYSQAVEAGDLVFVSGQIPLDPATGELISEDMNARMSNEALGTGNDPRWYCCLRVQRTATTSSRPQAD